MVFTKKPLSARSLRRRPDNCEAKILRSSKSKLSNKICKSHVNLKEIRIVLHDVKFSGLIPKHQRYLLFREEPKEITNNLHEEVPNADNDSHKEAIKSKSSQIKNSENSGLRVDHDDISNEKDQASVASSTEKGTNIDSMLLPVSIRSRSRRKRRISSSSDHTSISANNSSHSSELLKFRKRQKTCKNYSSDTRTTLTEPNDSDTSSKSCPNDSIKTKQNSMTLISGEQRKHIKLKNSTQKRMRRITSDSSKEDLVQIFQADTTVCTSNEEKRTISCDAFLTNCSNASVNYGIKAELVKEKIESTILNASTAVSNDKGDQIFVDTDLSTPKQLTVQGEHFITKIPPRITEELVLLDGNINFVTLKNANRFHNASKITLIDKRGLDGQEESSMTYTKKKFQTDIEALNSSTAEQPTNSTNNKNICEKNRNSISRLQTNVRTSKPVFVKYVKKGSPSLLDGYPPNNDNISVSTNTNNELCKTQQITMRSITAESLQKHGGKGKLKSASAEQLILKSSNNKNKTEKNVNVVNKLQTNVHSSKPLLVKNVKGSPSLLDSHQPNHDNISVSTNTNNELCETQQVAVGSLTAENLEKHGQKINTHIIVRTFIEQTDKTAPSNASVGNPKLSTAVESTKKPLPTESKCIILNRQRKINLGNETRTEKDHTKHDSQAHEFKRPTDIRTLPKNIDEQTKKKSQEPITVIKLKRSWKKTGCEVNKIDKSDVEDATSKNLYEIGKSCPEKVKTPTKYKVPEYVTLHNEKSTTPLAECGKHLNPHKDNCEENKLSTAESDCDDCISLFADSLCFSDNDLDDSIYVKNNTPKGLKKSVWSNDVQCNIVGSTNFDAYVKKNLDDFHKDLVTVQEEPDLRDLLTNRKQQSLQKIDNHSSNKSAPIAFQTKFSSTMNMMGNTTAHTFQFFRGYCFAYMSGICFIQSCRFVHSLPKHIDCVYSQNESEFWRILQFAIERRWFYFVAEFCRKSLQAMNGEDILKLLEFLYKACCLNGNIMAHIFTEIKNKNVSIQYVIRKLDFIRNDDVQLRQHILLLLEKQIAPGQFWETVKPLSPYIKSSAYFVERILRECINYQHNNHHIQEVHKDLMSSLHVTELALINANLLMNFYRLLQRGNTGQITQESISLYAKSNVSAENNVQQNVKQNTDQNVEENVAIELSTSESSTSSSSTGSTSTTSNDDNTHQTKRSTGTQFSIKSNQNDHTKQSANDQSRENDVKLVQPEQPFELQRIDDLRPSQSICRGTFSKYYEDLSGLKVALEDRNYDCVIDILSRVSGTDNISFYTDSCYQILQEEIMHSEQHLRKIIKRTVCRRVYNILHDVLNYVALRIIIDLADNGAWVRAYLLLRLVQKYVLQFDAAFVLLSAEIYLANRRTLDALSLLKQYNLIHTNRSKWHVHNTAKNVYHRMEVMHILLETLSWEFPMYASDLFQFLCADQLNNNYHPIDLTRHADRIMSMLLLRGSDESIVSMGRSILEFNIALRPITFRATIAMLVHRDEILARQMYRYATQLGVYNTAQFSSMVTFTINAAWTEEELYLAMSELIDRLSKDIGPAIEHLKPSNIKVFVNIETVPTDRELYSNEDTGVFHSNLSRNSCTMLQRILARRFDPPLRMQKKGKYCRLITTSVINYLKAHYCN